MTVSVFELFKIGIGPSSSHTVGPMVAARRFLTDLAPDAFSRIARVRVDLYGSLALTGHGHATDKAVVLGLAGEVPASVNPDAADSLFLKVSKNTTIKLLGTHRVAFSTGDSIVFNRGARLPHHSNGMTFTAWSGAGDELARESYYSVGGGFVVSEAETTAPAIGGTRPVPLPFGSAAELLDLGRRHHLKIDEIVLLNEQIERDIYSIFEGIGALWEAMSACIDRGCRGQGVLPGRLRVPKRASDLQRKLLAQGASTRPDPLAGMDWVNLWAIAVNEENAAGGKVVTAPTNGAAGIIPAVIKYYEQFCPGSDRTGIRRFLLAAAAIGSLYKQNASISGAEVGCQGEVGVACSMAAAGLTAALGGSNEQVENAAEIGMEHNLGLTCDPIDGLVQIPCIERNAIGAVKAINASRMALLGDGTHSVPLDKVIATMRQTGADMKEQYKETSTGGLAVNVVEC